MKKQVLSFALGVFFGYEGIRWSVHIFYLTVITTLVVLHFSLPH